MQKKLILLVTAFLLIVPFAYSGEVVGGVPEVYNEGNSQRTIYNSGTEGDTNWVTAYHYGPGSVDEVYWNYSTDYGMTWGPELWISDGNAVNVQTQSAAMDDDHNRVVVTWSDQVTSTIYFYHIRMCALKNTVNSCGTITDWSDDFNINLVDASWALTTGTKIPSMSCDFNSDNFLHCILTTDAPYGVVHAYVNADLNISESSNWVVADQNAENAGATRLDRSGMVIDGNDMINASWVSNNDDLYYSRRPSDLSTGWETPILISDNCTGTTDVTQMDWDPIDYNVSFIYSGTAGRLNYFWREYDGKTLGPALVIPTRVASSPATVGVAIDFNHSTYIFMDDRGTVANDRNVSYVIVYQNDLISPSVDVNSDNSGDPLSANISRFSPDGNAMVNYSVDISAAAGYDTIISGMITGYGSPAPPYPDVELTFVDEDTGVALNPSVTVSGGTACSPVAGVCDFNFTGSSATVTASLTNYGERKWTFGYDKDNNRIVKTLTMLKSIDGTTIQFTLRDITGSNLITDGNLTILHQDDNFMAGRFVIGSDSKFSAFLSPFDQNYTFVVEYSGSDFNFTRNEVKVKIPKDEDTTSNITPYDVKMRGIGTSNVLNSSLENNFKVFPYTNDFYIADVNASTYYGRNYYFRLSRGDYDENVVLVDSFIGSDGDPPNSANWFQFINGAGDANVLDNDLNLSTFGGASYVSSLLSDVNISFEIGDIYFFEWTTNARPTVAAGSGFLSGGFVPDNNANPATANPRYSIDRANDGGINLFYGGSTNNQNDNGAGGKKFKIRMERTGVDTYDITYYIDDTNAMFETSVTESHHVWKVGLWLRSGSSGISNGKIADSRLFSENFYEIQPYLAPQTQANQVTVKIQKIFEATTKLEGIRIVSNSYVEGAGLQQIETVVSDYQGQGVMSFLTNGTEYTIYLYNSSDELLHTFTVVISPSQTILSISTEGESAYPPTQKKRITVAFVPAGGTIASIDTNIVARIYYDVNVTITDINIIVQQNDLNLADLNATHFLSTSPFDTNISVNLGTLDKDLQFYIIVHITTEDGNSSYFAAIFNLAGGKVGGVDLLNDIIRGDFKTDMGCNADDWLNFCFPTFVLSMFLAIMFVAALLGAFQVNNPNLAVILFILLLGLFTYFYWIPLLFFAGLMVFAAITGIALVRVNL